MKNFFFLTGFLLSLTVGTVLTGQRIIVSKEAAIKSKIEATILGAKVTEAEMFKKMERGQVLRSDTVR